MWGREGRGGADRQGMKSWRWGDGGGRGGEGRIGQGMKSWGWGGGVDFQLCLQEQVESGLKTASARGGVRGLLKV